MIKIKDLEFEYYDRDDEGNLTDMINAIRGINFDVEKGEFIAVVGKNGSGKSTFAKIMNRLLVPIDGTVTICGMDALDVDNELEIRKAVGMVFQNPDDQLVGTIIAEDVAFGAENIGIPESMLWDRVFFGLEKAGLPATREFAARRLNELSGGEKQKCAIAGVLAMRPKCIVLDESTSMLDSKSRKELLDNMKKLNEELGITVILITHIMDELIFADRIYVMHMGKIVMQGRREAVLAKQTELSEYGLELPASVRLRNMLIENKVINSRHVFSVEELAERIKKEHPKSFFSDTEYAKVKQNKIPLDPKNAILFNAVSFGYGKKEILKNINLWIAKGEYACVMGPTGSGKSTLLQHIVALLKAKSGSVYVDGLDVADRTTDIKALRCKIGYVFQYPEHQLFAKNAYEDVVFGPRNVGISEVEAEKRAYEAIELVGLSSDVYDMPIAKLSGGIKKRVALAGVLAMKPEYLILDEPLSGLDPEGRRDMLKIIDILHRDVGMTILMITHDADAVLSHADRLIVMGDGEIKENGRPIEVFYKMAVENPDRVDLPSLTRLLVRLRGMGMPVNCMTFSEKEAVDDIKHIIGGRA